jgi:adenosylcobinamide-GDP ribazoletransferase
MRRALAFLTPLGGAAVPDGRTLSWFPAVGALVGAALGGIWWGAEQLWPPLVAAAIVIAADLALTGLLHADGLVDAADGLLPQAVTRERRLALMAEPTVGAYGVAVLGTALLLRFTALSSMEPNVLLIAAIWCSARTTMAVAARAVPYARTEGGLATALLGGDWRTVGGLGVIGALALAIVADGAAAGLAVVAGLAASGLVVWSARRRLGGFTGDVLGAAGVVGETIALVVAAARW